VVRHREKKRLKPAWKAVGRSPRDRSRLLQGMGHDCTERNDSSPAVDELKSNEAAYTIYQPPAASKADLARLSPEADPVGIQKMLFQGKWNSANQAYLKKMDKQEQDKIMVYTLLRSKCSPQLNALLSVSAEFLECPEDNPCRTCISSIACLFV
jgi:hypothetical protein